MKKNHIIIASSLLAISAASFASNQPMLQMQVKFVNQAHSAFSCQASGQLSGQWAWNKNQIMKANNTYHLNQLDKNVTMQGRDSDNTSVDLQCSGRTVAENFHVYASLGSNNDYNPIAFCTTDQGASIICAPMTSPGNKNKAATVKLYIEEKQVV